MAGLDLAAREPARRGLDDLELGDGGIAQSRHLLEPFPGRRDDFSERAESGQQGFGQRLDVAPRDGAKQYELEHLVVRERGCAGIEKAFAQPHTVIEEMRRRRSRRRVCGAFIAARGAQQLGHWWGWQHAPQ